MNLGIDDAVAVVEAVLTDRIDEYNNERRKIGAQIIRDTERVRKALVSKNLFVKIFVRIIFFLVQHVGAFQKIFAQKTTRL